MKLEAITRNDLDEIKNLQPDGWSDIGRKRFLAGLEGIWDENRIF